jgi:predicted phage-related endonuclease
MNKDELRNIVEQMIECQLKIKEYESRLKEYKISVANFMKENNLEKLDAKQAFVTYVKPSTRKTIDSKKLKKDLPDIYNKYVKETKTSESVRLNIKKDENN